MSVLGTFRSDIRPLARIIGSIGIWGTVLMTVAAIYGQVQANRFPNYTDLAGVVLITPALCLAGLLVSFGLTRAFPVQITSGGLRCYDLRGRYHVIRWSDMRHARVVDPHGLGMRYVYIESASLKPVLTLPLWLNGIDRFLALAEREAGSDNKLVVAIKGAT